MRVWASRREGRGHRARGQPCQDAYATWRSGDGGRVACAVADGLGSRPLSDLGSQAACDAAVASLAAEPAWDEAAVRRAFDAARLAVEQVARDRVAPLADLATTLQLAAVTRSGMAAGMVGDGAIVVSPGHATSPAAARLLHVEVLLPPAESEYANVVVPLTADDWRGQLRTAARDGPCDVLLFTDGLTRLLLRREGPAWRPFAPFFEAFLPGLDQAGADLVGRFLADDALDRAWDDDKCLAVVAQELPAPSGVTHAGVPG